MPKEVRSLVEGLLVNHVEVAINITRPITNIQHSFYQVDSCNKSSLLKTILKEEHVCTTLVFTRTKHKARNLALQLTKNGFKATSLQGNLSQQQRQRALDGFKSGTYNILVATDIAARGIDVAGISHVINYDMPGTAAAYTHRTGRTGRASQSGEALTFTTAEDYQMIKSLERTLEGKLVYRNSPELAAQNFSNTDKTNQAVQNKTTPKVSRTHRKVRGKRSSQRNRAAAFDFGFHV
jgi:superfamily II DNA/RNA helicase